MFPFGRSEVYFNPYLRRRKIKRPNNRGNLANINKIVYADAILQDITGLKSANRAKYVQAVWKYIKKNKLQKIGDGRIIIPDARLAQLMGVEGYEMNAFTMLRYIERHVKREEHEPNQEQAGGANPFGQASGANPFGQASGANPFGQASGANPFGQASGANPFGQNGGANQGGQAEGTIPFGQVGGANTGCQVSGANTGGQASGANTGGQAGGANTDILDGGTREGAGKKEKNG